MNEKPQSLAGGNEVSFALLAGAVEAAHDGILITDAELERPGPRIVYVNEALLQMTGYEAGELIGNTPRMLQGPDTDRRVIDRLKQRLRNGDPFAGRTVNYRRDGTPFSVEWRVNALRDAAGRVSHFVSVQRDVSAEEIALEQMSADAELDSLTRVPDRLAVETAAEREVGRAQRHGTMLSAILFDIDDTSTLNARHGYAAVDEALNGLAQRIFARLRVSDAFGRWSGDSFLIVLPHTLGSEAAQIGEAVLEHVSTGEGLNDVRPTASVGVAEWMRGLSAQALIERAGEAMIRARAEGGNRVIGPR